MATRNRTLVFITFRNERISARRVSSSFGSSKINVKEPLLSSENSTELEDIELGKNKKFAIPPSWMNIVEDIHENIRKIKQKMKRLSEAHTTHLTPQFDENEEDEQTIEILTAEITKMFHVTQSKIQKIGSQGLSTQEEPLKKNLQSSLANELQELSVKFRKDQKDYLQRLKARQQKKTGFALTFDNDNENDGNFEVSFTRNQLNAVANSEESVVKREQEIQQIARSINELATVFKDLAYLVIEQGTVLDRIDYNLEQVSHHTEEGVNEILKAQKEQKKYRNKLCMLLLCLSILIMIVVILIRGVS